MAIYNFISLYEVLKVHASQLLSSLSFAKGADMSPTKFELHFCLFSLSLLDNGDEGIRTPDPLLARQVLSQLSYTPVGFCLFCCFSLSTCFLFVFRAMGLSGLEPPTSRLSGVRSNRLSYKPVLFTLLTY